ncbi:MAG: ribosome recycling factor [Dehalococcoidia bacterium]|nr:ribosome recycling factor [Dehalococcoidia bacterium]MSQ34288.1 ribosome recycling factor [Dehalococcoidia bacterium]
MTEAALSEARHKMDATVQALDRDLIGVRTNRASPGLVEHIKVDYHGTVMPLNQMAQITVAEARSLVIQPWDKSALGMIEKALQKSDLGVMPKVEKDLLRLIMPALTEERRRDINKMVGKRGEESRISIRNIRRDALDKIKAAEKSSELSEDQSKRFQTQVQKLTDEGIAKVDAALKKKEAEIMQV